MGNSTPRSSGRCSGSVHPHVHGELTTAALLTLRERGSSPRAWGTLVTPGLPPVSYRFIPTCMGNSKVGRGRIDEVTVHPHVHGELPRSQISEIAPCGSSPRAWGTRDTPIYKIGRARFIPTCMGNSTKTPTGPSACSVHPHVHGELLPEPDLF